MQMILLCLPMMVQHFSCCFPRTTSCQKMSLRINIKKAKATTVGEQIDFYIDGHKSRTVQQRHMRSILNVRWDHFITNDELLDLPII